jgi:PhzF family phenazine biosynthesis protein
MSKRPFAQVDVFTETPCQGNPVAVVLDAGGLSDPDMRQFAAWTNLSETTFVLPPKAGGDYQVRIFTPSVELPFAGHPTLGTCHAWLEAGGVPHRAGEVVQECPAGLVTIRQDEGRLAFAAPPLVRSGPVDEPLARRIADGLNIDRSAMTDIQWADNGPGWVAVLLDSAAAVLAVRPGDLGNLQVGIAGPYPGGEPAALEVRAFFAKDGSTAEDPVTGSLNASLAQWLLATGRVTAPYVASQGTVLGRRGRVHVSTGEAGQVWVGGGTVTLIEGTADL